MITEYQDNLQGAWESFWRWPQSSYHFGSNVQVSFGLEKNRLVVLCFPADTERLPTCVSQMAAVVADHKGAGWVAGSNSEGAVQVGQRREGLTLFEDKYSEGDFLRKKIIQYQQLPCFKSTSNVSKLRS